MFNMHSCTGYIFNRKIYSQKHVICMHKVMKWILSGNCNIACRICKRITSIGKKKTLRIVNRSMFSMWMNHSDVRLLDFPNEKIQRVSTSVINDIEIVSILIPMKCDYLITIENTCTTKSTEQILLTLKRFQNLPLLNKIKLKV